MLTIGGIDMQSIRENLIEGLKENTGLEVYFLMPPVNINVSLPLIVLEEVNNLDHFYEDEFEIASITYDISVYADKAIDILVFEEVIDKYMKRIGMKKSYTGGDNYIEPLYCKTMTFTGKVRKHGETYYIYS
jgi:hypothetical protein